MYFRLDKSGSLPFGSAGAFQITKHVPVSDGDLQYQLKGADHERVAMEREITRHPPVVNASVILRDPFHGQKGVQTKKAGGKPKTKMLKELKQAIYISLNIWRRGLKSNEIKTQLRQQVNKKLKALMNHYNIPTNSSDKWKDLSLCLAEELGLMTVTLDQPRGSGAPPVWSKAERRLLERWEGESTRDPRKRAREIAETLIKKYPKEYGDLTWKSLVNRRGEANRRAEAKRREEQIGVPLSESSLKQHWLAGLRLRRRK